MKDLLNKTVKVKHLLIIVVLLFAAKFILVVNRPHFPRHRQVAKFEHRGRQMKHDFKPNQKGRQMRGDFKNLSDVEKASVDSLKSLLVKGDRENNVVIIKQIKSIIKK